LAALRVRMSAQDRALIESSLSSMFDLGLLVKSATVMRIPTVYDYEPLVGYRLGNYFSAMWHGSPITSGQALMTAPTVLAGYRRRLSDLASIRYLVTPATSRFPPPGAEFSAVEAGDPGLRVFTALTAPPPARFVSRVEVIDEPDTLLSRLAYGNDDLTAVALVEEPFPSGFAGERDGDGSGTVRFVRDDPERIVLDVDAPARGFLVLADQDAPGWRATVNGTPAPIRRANYAVRAIEVPAGRSRVEFRYRPGSVATGAAISALALVTVGAILVGRGRRQRGS